MPPQEPSPRSPLRQPPPIGTILLLILACLPYAGMAACLGDLRSGGLDAMGRGFDEAFAVIFGIAVWGLLGTVTLIGGIKGNLPLWAGIAAAILIPLSAAAALISLNLVGPQTGWLIYVPLAMPPVIAAYALWARIAALHRALPPTPTSAVALGLLGLLILAPMPHFAAKLAAQVARDRREAAAAAAAQAREQQRRAENLARFRRLDANSPLWEWAAFFGKNSELDAEAIAGARKLTHRQADAEEALRRRMGFPLVEYWRLDLAVTPAFCAAAIDFLGRDPPPPAKPDIYAIEDYYDPYVDSIELLTRANCDINATVKHIEAIVLSAPDNHSRAALLGVLEWRRGNGFMKRGDDKDALAHYTAAIGYSPDSEQFYVSRAFMLIGLGRCDKAIADYSEAIRLNPGYSLAFNGRAVCEEHLGDDAQAMRDFEEAIRRDPGFARAHDNRGALFSAQGDQQRAIRDFDEALRLLPTFRRAQSDRGRALYYLGQYKDAAADFAAVVAAEPADAYSILWLALARFRMGQPPRDLAQQAKALDRTAWPFPVVAAYLGETDAGTVLAATRSDSDPSGKDHECEAAFYLGAKEAAGGGDPAAARILLQRAVAVCPRWFVEAPAARFELARLPP